MSNANPPVSQGRGGVKQHRPQRPVSKAAKAGNKLARAAIATGQAAVDAEARREERDRRTLYLRFKAPAALPEDESEVRALHPGIRQVRVLRHGRKADRRQIKFCFAEFDGEEECAAALEEVRGAEVRGGAVYADFVGKKAKVKTGQRGRDRTAGAGKARMPLNPARLLVMGFPNGAAANQKKLKKVTQDRGKNQGQP